MNFHLPFSIRPFKKKLKYTDTSLFIGSCFAENIGEKFYRYKFNSIINPHGIIYNPASIAVTLNRYLDNKHMVAGELFYANECWNSWEHHSRFSDPDQEVCLVKINNGIADAHQFIKNGDWVFITFGSAFIYTLNKTGDLVGNCHKQPQKEFTKRLLEIDEIVKTYTHLLQQLKEINSTLKIVFTVSPVRYIRDGVIENNLSKARLIEVVHRLIGQNQNTFYFPAYELVMDDLRDYRFYKTDLVHPTDQATEYVFEKLLDSLMDEEAKQLLEKIKDILVAMHHKPFNAGSEAYRKFKIAYLERCSQLQSTHPFLNLKSEMEFFGK